MTRASVADEMVEVPDCDKPIWWPFCATDGCFNRVCTWRSGYWCYPCSDAHGVANPRPLPLDR